MTEGAWNLSGLPQELIDALSSDADARAIFHGLSAVDRYEYAAYVREAKKPETRVRRGTKVVELIHRRHQRKAELKARGKAPITSATDEVLATVIAPDLRSAGFRKKGRSWTKESTTSTRGVHASGHWTNQTTSGVLFVLLSCRYPHVSGGRADDAVVGYSFSLGSLAIGERRFEFRNADDPADRLRVGTELQRAWVGDFGREFLLAADDPRYLLSQLIEHGDVNGHRAAAELADALGDEASVHEALARFFVDMRDDALVPDPRGNPNPLGWLLLQYRLISHRFTSRTFPLDPIDRQRLVAVIEDNLDNIEGGGHQLSWYRRPSEIAQFEELVQYLELDVDVRAAIDRGRQMYSGMDDVGPLPDRYRAPVADHE